MKYTTQLCTITLVILTGFAVLAGCSKARIPGLVKCEGTVTWKGEPVEGARVAFTPKDSQNGRGAQGMTDANGKFKATTLDPDDGIMPGEYVVTVIKRIATRGGSPPPSSEGGNPDVPGGAPPPREEMQVTYYIPQIYADATVSGLSAVIPSKGTKDLLFELVGEIVNTPPARAR
jgi:hypothetical protein